MTRASVSDETPRIRLSSPGDLLSLIPYLLGFHPRDSLVAVGLRAGQVVVTLRLDLPPAGRPDGPTEPPDASLDAVTDQTVAALGAQSIDGVVLVGYGGGRRVAPVAAAATTALRAADLPVWDSLRAEDGRYWSYVCHDPACCPPEGTPYGDDAGRVAAEATLAGLVALPDRNQLAAQLAPVEGPARAAMDAATRRAQQRRQAVLDSAATFSAGYTALLADGRSAVRAAVRRHRRGGTLSDDEVAWLGVVLHELPVRDAAWLAADDGTPIHHRALWTDVLRRVDPRYVPAPAALLGYVCWQQGDGGVAGMALSRALDIDPTYRMATLLGRVLAAGMPPTAWRVTDQAPDPADDDASGPASDRIPDPAGGRTHGAAGDRTSGTAGDHASGTAGGRTPGTAGGRAVGGES